MKIVHELLSYGEAMERSGKRMRDGVREKKVKEKGKAERGETAKVNGKKRDPRK